LFVVSFQNILEFNLKAKSKTFALTDWSIEIFIFSASVSAFSIIAFPEIVASFIILSLSLLANSSICSF
jgi:hypothetical protein